MNFMDVWWVVALGGWVAFFVVSYFGYMRRSFSMQERVYFEKLHEALKRVDVAVLDMEKGRISAHAMLTEQMRALYESQQRLHHETGHLVKALRSPHVRGRWGEIQLKRVVEMAGMLNHCDFFEQVSFTTEGGERLRPDMIVHLPGGKKVVIDAKTTLHSYLEAVESKDDETRIAKMKEHARQLRKHVSDLSAKSYWDQFEETPEFVVLFIPGESFFSAALEQDPSLIEYGVDGKVMIATPTTLIMLLRSVAYGWKQELVAKNAQEISKWGSELYERLRVFVTHIDDVKRGLEKAVDGYNRAARSLETRVFPAARRFQDLGVSVTEEPLSLSLVEKALTDHSPQG